MKRKYINNNYLDEALKTENLLQSFYNVKKTCNNKKGIMKFEMNLNTNIQIIYDSLKNETYEPKKYSIFMINEKKPRIVMSQCVEDKIVNNFVAKFILIPNLDKTLIKQNVATRKGMGVKTALDYIEKYLNILNLNKKQIYVLKLDIYKYFYSINKEILLSMIDEKLNDSKTFRLLSKMLAETSKDYVRVTQKKLIVKYNADIPLYYEQNGLGIGCVVSQFLAIFYLNKLDHFIKEKLKCKYYVRYQDDLIILSNDKDYLKECWQKINTEILKLDLKLNKKSNIISLKNGFDFLGANFKIIDNKLFIMAKRKTYNNIRKKIHIAYRKDNLTYKRVIGSYHGYLSKYNLPEYIGDFKMSIEEKYNVVKEKYPKYILIIRKGDFLYSYNDDAAIIHFLLDYKYKFNKNETSYGKGCLFNVVNKFSELSLGYVIYDDTIQVYKGNESIYDNLCTLAKIKIQKQFQRYHLIELIDSIMEKDSSLYDDLSNYLEDKLKYIEDSDSSQFIEDKDLLDSIIEN